jgi:hypothetical protein
LVQAGIADLSQMERFYRIASSHPKPRVEYLYSNPAKSSVSAIQHVSGNRTRHFDDQVSSPCTGRLQPRRLFLDSHAISRGTPCAKGSLSSQRIALIGRNGRLAVRRATECVLRRRLVAWNGHKLRK